MLQPKLPVHINNQYPMSHSPPIFDSSSPGPDPYHSLQSLHNVYEELHPTHDSDADSEFHPHSDDDFAEDELSLAGETTAVLMATSTSTSASTPNHPEACGSQGTAIIPTIFNESNMSYRRMTGNNDASSNAILNMERDSMHSLVSSANDRNGAGDSSCSSRSSSGATRISRNTEHNTGNSFVRNHSKTLNNRDINSPDHSGLPHHFNQYHNHVNMNNGNGNGNGNGTNKRLNNSNRVNNNTIGGHHHSHGHHPHGHSVANNNLRSKSRDNVRSNGTSATCTECRVERQNLVNRQMSSTMHKKRNGNHGSQIDHHHPSGISTIYQERVMNGNGNHFGFTDKSTTSNPCPSWTNGNQRMRTMPYATTNCQTRMNSSAIANNHHDPAYDYAQPVFHEGLLYDTGFTSDVGRLQPEYTSLGSSASGVSSGNHPHAIYSRDSSFGSDSGYSRGESGGSASGNVFGLGLGRLKKQSSNNKMMGKSVL